LQVKKYIENGNPEIARVHAENAIRQHNQSINYLKLSSRMDSVVSRLQSTQAMKAMSKQMAQVSQTMVGGGATVCSCV
jgi:charged multivesicular body protein 1